MAKIKPQATAYDQPPPASIGFQPRLLIPREKRLAFRARIGFENCVLCMREVIACASAGLDSRFRGRGKGVAKAEKRVAGAEKRIEDEKSESRQ